jgi:hypothetical protein
LSHRHFSHTDWALSLDLVSKIETVAEKLAPKNPLNLYRRLFSSCGFDFYDENTSYEEQQKKREELRRQAIETILADSGINAVIDFAEFVEFPNDVGCSAMHTRLGMGRQFG